MVSGVLSLTRNGLRDWIIQRVTAVVLGAYFIYLLCYFLMHPGLMYVQWVLLFQSTCFRIFTLISLLSLVLHTWIGIWTVITDYVKPPKLRAGVQIVVALALIAFLLAGIEIIWGIY